MTILDLGPKGQPTAACTEKRLGPDGALLTLSRETLDARLAEWPAEAAHLRPVFEAVRDRGLTFITLQRGARMRLPAEVLSRPRLIHIGDDLETSKGPAAFDAKSLRAAFSGARGILVHAAAPEAIHYAGAAGVAILTGGSSVVVETQTAHEGAWMALASKLAPSTPVLLITAEPHRYAHQGGRA